MNHQQTNVEWLPDKISFRYINSSVEGHRPAEIEIADNREIRNGWLTHPQLAVQSDHNVIDVGSGYGFYTLAALAIGANHVYAFDKNKEMVRILRENLRINNNSFVERCSVINRTISPITTSLDDFFYNELSFTPRNIKWIIVNIGGQDELNVISKAVKIIENNRPLSVLMYHYDGQTGHSNFNQQFLMANGFDAKSVGIKIAEDRVISTSYIY